MRRLMIATALCLTAGAALAGPVEDAQAKITKGMREGRVAIALEADPIRTMKMVCGGGKTTTPFKCRVNFYAVGNRLLPVAFSEDPAAFTSIWIVAGTLPPVTVAEMNLIIRTQGIRE